MPWYQAFVLGLVQGFSEFLPISSSGHLLLTRWVFGWDPPGDESVEKNSFPLVPGVLMRRPGWLPGPTFLLTTLLIITRFRRAKRSGRGHLRISILSLLPHLMSMNSDDAVSVG